MLSDALVDLPAPLDHHHEDDLRLFRDLADDPPRADARLPQVARAL